jgi:hypothetical protein
MAVFSLGLKYKHSTVPDFDRQLTARRIEYVLHQLGNSDIIQAEIENIFPTCGGSHATCLAIRKFQSKFGG